MTTDDDDWLRMPGVLRGTCGFVRVVDSGAIEVEIYDHSEAVHAAFDSDSATIYTIGQSALPALAGQLASQFNEERIAVADLPARLTKFRDIFALVDWLVNASGVPFTKRVDFSV